MWEDNNFIEVIGSMSRDALRNKTRSGFVGFLYEGTARTAEDDHEVTDEGSLDALPFSDLLPHSNAQDNVQNGHTKAEAIHRTRMADSLGHLAGSVAGNQIGDDTNTNVAETRE